MIKVLWFFLILIGCLTLMFLGIIGAIWLLDNWNWYKMKRAIKYERNRITYEIKKRLRIQ